MLPIKHVISCKRCPYSFQGDIVCMNCDTGYAIQMPPEIVEEQQHARLIKIYRMETERIKSKIRCKMHNLNQLTEVVVPFETETTENYGHKIETYRFLMDNLQCPDCSEQMLKYDFDEPDTCPSCGKNALSKSLIWGSFV